MFALPPFSLKQPEDELTDSPVVLDLDFSARAAYKKGAGKVLVTPSRQARRMNAPYVLRDLVAMFSPRPDASRAGPLFTLHPGRGPEHQTKERQQQQDSNASHAANLLYPARPDLRRAGRQRRKTA